MRANYLFSVIIPKGTRLPLINQEILLSRCWMKVFISHWRKFTPKCQRRPNCLTQAMYFAPILLTRYCSILWTSTWRYLQLPSLQENLGITCDGHLMQARSTYVKGYKPSKHALQLQVANGRIVLGTYIIDTGHSHPINQRHKLIQLAVCIRSQELI